MKHLKFTVMVLSVFAILVQGNLSFAQTRRAPAKKYNPYVTPANPVDTRWAQAHSPWDFSAMLALYSPGFGVGARAAYRILDSLIPDVDDSMSIEAGIGYVGASNTYGGLSVSYSLIEIPVLARWDFRLDN